MPARVQHRRVSRRQWLSGGQAGKMGAQMIEGEVGDLIVIRGQGWRPSVAEGTSPSASTPLWSMKPPALSRRPVRPAFSAN
ncbi:MAG: hypothetical protein A3J80_10435 [Desulfobacula sp. RIFOXYB2_FULL_45_6]|nr:MAG: hypothetical protein A3J80_10435 [Desulfobacula sp. RIFOXYB2_FULL_45_6]